MAGIAISYRRGDTGWITGRIFDRLKEHYQTSEKAGPRGKPIVFMDYDSTPVGADFRNYIRGVLDSCDVLLAVIGPRWEGDDEQGRPRILQDSDWVRIEIETALKKNIPIIPILIDRTPMPRADMLPEGLRDLAYRQAATVDTQVDFNSHIERLIREIDRILGVKTAPIAPIQPDESGPLGRRTGPRLSYVLASISLCALVAIPAAIFWWPRKVIDPVYTAYSSTELGVTVIFPNNIVTLDNTQRKQLRLAFRDAGGQPLIYVLRTALPEHKDPKAGRENEIADLTRMNFILTYVAPEKEHNWANWYVLSGLNHGAEFYFRRWYADDSVVSMEFMYQKELAPLFDKVIPTMTHEFVYTSTAPKN
jgi:hypothetical protein